jgi:hypothetical protein
VKLRPDPDRRDTAGQRSIKTVGAHRGRRIAAAGALTLIAAACSTSSAPIVRNGPTTTAPSATANAPTTPPPTTAPSTTTPAATAQTVTVTPATGLTTGQTVTVTATGFSPNESLAVTECADKGTATGPGDCDLTNLQTVTSDANGQVVKIQFTVTKGPFGANNTVCGPTQPCLISVTQATPSPTQEADEKISFG